MGYISDLTRKVVNFNKYDYEQLQKIAKAKRLAISQVIRLAASEYLKNHKPQAEIDFK
jgi:hypothetical protein